MPSDDGLAKRITDDGNELDYEREALKQLQLSCGNGLLVDIETALARAGVLATLHLAKITKLASK